MRPVSPIRTQPTRAGLAIEIQTKGREHPMSQALKGVVQGVKSEPKSFSNGVKGLILCGGEGARLRPLTYYFQKSMIPIGSKQRPLLEFIVRSLKQNEITNICFLVGYKWEQVSNYFDDGSRFGVKIAYVHDKPEYKGTGGAVLNAYKQGLIDRKDLLLVYYGDILSDVNLTEMLKEHLENGAEATVALSKGYQVPVGVAELNGGRVVKLVEKPSFDVLVGIGILALEGSVLADLEALYREGGEVDLMRDLLPILMKNGRQVRGYVTDAFWYDVGSTERYEKLDNDSLAHYFDD